MDSKPDTCSCKNPWRFDEKKTKGEIKTLQESIDNLWASLSKKVQMTVFVLVISILSTTLGAVVWASYDTAKETYHIVLKIGKDIEVLKAQIGKT